jgi:hypothetical protein
MKIEGFLYQKYPAEEVLTDPGRPIKNGRRGLGLPLNRT